MWAMRLLAGRSSKTRALEIRCKQEEMNNNQKQILFPKKKSILSNEVKSTPNERRDYRSMSFSFFNLLTLYMRWTRTRYTFIV